MKILISGATGFIGKHLVKRLISENHAVYAVVRPSTDTIFLKNEGIPFHIFDNDTEKLISFINEEQFDGVIHLASLFLKNHKIENISELIDSNVSFGSILLEASSKNNVKWFLNTGTFWQHYQSKKYSPVNLYAATKEAFETIAQYYIETSNINFATIKLSDTFGPDDTRPKILNLWAKIAKSGETLEMSPGNQIIDISYIDNVIDGFSRMVELLSKDKKNKLCGKSFALKSKERVTLKKLSEIFEKITGVKLQIKWGAKDYMPREVMVPWKNGKSIPGWKPKVTTKEGINKTFKKYE